MVSSQDHCLFSFYLFIPLNPPHCLQSSFSDTSYHVIALLKTFNGSPPSVVWCPRTSAICLQSIFLDSSSAILPFLPCTLAMLNYLPSADRPFHSHCCAFCIPSVLYLPPSISPSLVNTYPTLETRLYSSSSKKPLLRDLGSQCIVLCTLMAHCLHLKHLSY